MGAGADAVGQEESWKSSWRHIDAIEPGHLRGCRGPGKRTPPFGSRDEGGEFIFLIYESDAEIELTLCNAGRDANVVDIYGDPQLVGSPSGVATWSALFSGAQDHVSLAGLSIAVPRFLPTSSLQWASTADWRQFTGECYERYVRSRMLFFYSFAVASCNPPNLPQSAFDRFT